VSLSGRPQARPTRRERKIAKRARGAPPGARHGPLQARVRTPIILVRSVTTMPSVTTRVIRKMLDRCVKSLLLYESFRSLSRPVGQWLQRLIYDRVDLIGSHKARGGPSPGRAIHFNHQQRANHRYRPGQNQLPPALDTWHIGLPKKHTRTPAAEAKRHNSHGGKINDWPVTAHWGSNGEVEGPHRSAPWRRGRTISQRPRRQAANASRTPPTIVRRPWAFAPRPAATSENFRVPWRSTGNTHPGLAK
jgi:hypothetical protein